MLKMLNRDYFKQKKANRQYLSIETACHMLIVNLFILRQKRDGRTGETWDSTKRKLDWREEEERGQEYLRRLDEEEVASKRMELDEDVFLNESEEIEDISMEIPDEILAEFCESEEQEEQGEQGKQGESEPAKTQRNMMKIPHFILMCLKNNTGDQEAADLATGQEDQRF